MVTPTAKPVTRRRPASDVRMTRVVVLFFVAAFTLPLLLIGGHVAAVVAGIYGATAAIVLIKGLRTLLRGRSTSRLRSRENRRPVIKVAASSGVIALCVFLMVHVLSESDEQRCIDGQTMTVISSSQCDDSTGPAFGTGAYISIDPEWYYGGTGLQVGDEVQGGSLTAPNDWGGGNSGGNGSDDGSDGDSGGEDAGGGDGE